MSNLSGYCTFSAVKDRQVCRHRGVGVGVRDRAWIQKPQPNMKSAVRQEGPSSSRWTIKAREEGGELLRSELVSQVIARGEEGTRQRQ